MMAPSCWGLITNKMSNLTQGINMTMDASSLYHIMREFSCNEAIRSLWLGLHYAVVPIFPPSVHRIHRLVKHLHGMNLHGLILNIHPMAAITGTKLSSQNFTGIPLGLPLKFLPNVIHCSDLSNDHKKKLHQIQWQF